MNKIYKLKFNRQSCQLDAVSEIATNAANGSASSSTKTALEHGSSTVYRLGKLISSLALVSLGTTTLAYADGRTEMNVVHGSANVVTNGLVTSITTTPNTVINWKDFNVAPNEILKFVQQNSNSAVLNRVLGGRTSEILGQLSSNGRVFIVNPAGIIFGKNAVVDAAGLVASTLDISDDDFVSGKYVFNQEKDSAIAQILNQGLIKINDDGTLALVGGQVVNTGSLTAKNGTVYLAAGKSITIADLSNPLISYTVTAGNKAVNLGQIVAKNVALIGNKVAHGQTSATEFAEILSNYSGSADQASITATGDVVLYGVDTEVALTGFTANNTASTGVEGGITVVNGTVATSNTTGKAGTVTVLGDQVLVENATQICATGQTGGTIYVGGDFTRQDTFKQANRTIVADGVQMNVSAVGDAGCISVYGNRAELTNTTFIADSQTGKGGFVEVSAQKFIIDSLNAYTNSELGEDFYGSLLLDPDLLIITNDTNKYNELVTKYASDSSISVIQNPSGSININVSANIGIYIVNYTNPKEVNYNFTVGGTSTTRNFADGTKDITGEAVHFYMENSSINGKTVRFLNNLKASGSNKSYVKILNSELTSSNLFFSLISSFEVNHSNITDTNSSIFTGPTSATNYRLALSNYTQTPVVGGDLIIVNGSYWKDTSGYNISQTVTSRGLAFNMTIEDSTFETAKDFNYASIYGLSYLNFNNATLKAVNVHLKDNYNRSVTVNNTFNSTGKGLTIEATGNVSIETQYADLKLPNLTINAAGNVSITASNFTNLVIDNLTIDTTGAATGSGFVNIATSAKNSIRACSTNTPVQYIQDRQTANTVAFNLSNIKVSAKSNVTFSPRAYDSYTLSYSDVASQNVTIGVGLNNVSLNNVSVTGTNVIVDQYISVPDSAYANGSKVTPYFTNLTPRSSSTFENLSFTASEKVNFYTEVATVNGANFTAQDVNLYTGGWIAKQQVYGSNFSNVTANASGNVNVITQSFLGTLNLSDSALNAAGDANLTGMFPTIENTTVNASGSLVFNVTPDMSTSQGTDTEALSTIYANHGKTNGQAGVFGYVYGTSYNPFTESASVLNNRTVAAKLVTNINNSSFTASGGTASFNSTLSSFNLLNTNVSASGDIKFNVSTAFSESGILNFTGTNGQYHVCSTGGSVSFVQEDVDTYVNYFDGSSPLGSSNEHSFISDNYSLVAAAGQGVDIKANTSIYINHADLSGFSVDTTNLTIDHTTVTETAASPSFNYTNVTEYNILNSSVNTDTFAPKDSVVNLTISNTTVTTTNSLDLNLQNLNVTNGSKVNTTGANTYINLNATNNLAVNASLETDTTVKLKAENVTIVDSTITSRQKASSNGDFEAIGDAKVYTSNTVYNVHDLNFASVNGSVTVDNVSLSDTNNNYAKFLAKDLVTLNSTTIDGLGFETNTSLFMCGTNIKYQGNYNPTGISNLTLINTAITADSINFTQANADTVGALVSGTTLNATAGNVELNFSLVSTEKNQVDYSIRNNNSELKNTFIASQDVIVNGSSSVQLNNTDVCATSGNFSVTSQNGSIMLGDGGVINATNVSIFSGMSNKSNVRKLTDDAIVIGSNETIKTTNLNITTNSTSFGIKLDNTTAEFTSLILHQSGSSVVDGASNLDTLGIVITNVSHLVQTAGSASLSLTTPILKVQDGSSISAPGNLTLTAYSLDVTNQSSISAANVDVLLANTTASKITIEDGSKINATGYSTENPSAGVVNLKAYDLYVANGSTIEGNALTYKNHGSIGGASLEVDNGTISVNQSLDLNLAGFATITNKSQISSQQGNLNITTPYRVTVLDSTLNGTTGINLKADINMTFNAAHLNSSAGDVNISVAGGLDSGGSDAYQTTTFSNGTTIEGQNISILATGSSSVDKNIAVDGSEKQVEFNARGNVSLNATKGNVSLYNASIIGAGSVHVKSTYDTDKYTLADGYNVSVNRTSITAGNELNITGLNASITNSSALTVQKGSFNLYSRLALNFSNSTLSVTDGPAHVHVIEGQKTVFDNLTIKANNSDFNFNTTRFNANNEENKTTANADAELILDNITFTGTNGSDVKFRAEQYKQVNFNNSNVTTDGAAEFSINGTNFRGNNLTLNAASIDVYGAQGNEENSQFILHNSTLISNKQNINVSNIANFSLYGAQSVFKAAAQGNINVTNGVILTEANVAGGELNFNAGYLNAACATIEGIDNGNVSISLTGNGVTEDAQTNTLNLAGTNVIGNDFTVDYVVTENVSDNLSNANVTVTGSIAIGATNTNLAKEGYLNANNTVLNAGSFIDLTVGNSAFVNSTISGASVTINGTGTASNENNQYFYKIALENSSICSTSGDINLYSNASAEFNNTTIGVTIKNSNLSASNKVVSNLTTASTSTISNTTVKAEHEINLTGGSSLVIDKGSKLITNLTNDADDSKVFLYGYQTTVLDSYVQAKEICVTANAILSICSTDLIAGTEEDRYGTIYLESPTSIATGGDGKNLNASQITIKSNNLNLKSLEVNSSNKPLILELNESANLESVTLHTKGDIKIGANKISVSNSTLVAENGSLLLGGTYNAYAGYGEEPTTSTSVTSIEISCSSLGAQGEVNITSSPYGFINLTNGTVLKAENSGLNITGGALNISNNSNVSSCYTIGLEVTNFSMANSNLIAHQSIHVNSTSAEPGTVYNSSIYSETAEATFTGGSYNFNQAKVNATYITVNSTVDGASIDIKASEFLSRSGQNSLNANQDITINSSSFNTDLEGGAAFTSTAGGSQIITNTTINATEATLTANTGNFAVDEVTINVTKGDVNITTGGEFNIKNAETCISATNGNINLTAGIITSDSMGEDKLTLTAGGNSDATGNINLTLTKDEESFFSNLSLNATNKATIDAEGKLSANGKLEVNGTKGAAVSAKGISSQDEVNIVASKGNATLSLGEDEASFTNLNVTGQNVSLALNATDGTSFNGQTTLNATRGSVEVIAANAGFTTSDSFIVNATKDVNITAIGTEDNPDQSCVSIAGLQVTAQEGNVTIAALNGKLDFASGDAVVTAGNNVTLTGANPNDGEDGFTTANADSLTVQGKNVTLGSTKGGATFKDVNATATAGAVNASAAGAAQLQGDNKFISTSTTWEQGSSYGASLVAACISSDGSGSLNVSAGIGSATVTATEGDIELSGTDLAVRTTEMGGNATVKAAGSITLEQAEVVAEYANAQIVACGTLSANGEVKVATNSGGNANVTAGNFDLSNKLEVIANLAVVCATNESESSTFAELNVIGRSGHALFNSAGDVTFSGDTTIESTNNGNAIVKVAKNLTAEQSLTVSGNITAVTAQSANLNNVDVKSTVGDATINTTGGDLILTGTASLNATKTATLSAAGDLDTTAIDSMSVRGNDSLVHADNNVNVGNLTVIGRNGNATLSADNDIFVDSDKTLEVSATANASMSANNINADSAQKVSMQGANVAINATEAYLNNTTLNATSGDVNVSVENSLIFGGDDDTTNLLAQEGNVSVKAGSIEFGTADTNITAKGVTLDATADSGLTLTNVKVNATAYDAIVRSQGDVNLENTEIAAQGNTTVSAGDGNTITVFTSNLTAGRELNLSAPDGRVEVASTNLTSKTGLNITAGTISIYDNSNLSSETTVGLVATTDELRIENAVVNATQSVHLDATGESTSVQVENAQLNADQTSGEVTISALNGTTTISGSDTAVTAANVKTFNTYGNVEVNDGATLNATKGNAEIVTYGNVTLDNAQINATENVTLSTGNLTASGPTTLTGENVQAWGMGLSLQDITVSASNRANLSAHTALNVESSTLTSGTDDLSLCASQGSINVSSSTLNSTSANVTFNNSQAGTNGDISVKESTIEAKNKAVNFNVGNDLTLDDTTVVAKDDLNVSANNVNIENDSSLTSTAGSIDITANEAVSVSGSTVDAQGGNANTTAKNITYNDSTITAAQNVDITSTEGDINFTATPITSGGNVTIDSAANIKGELADNGKGSEITAANNVEVKAKQDVELPSATITATSGNASVTGQNIDLQSSSLIACQTVTLNATDGNIAASNGKYVSNSANVVIKATGNFTAEDAQIYANAAAVEFAVEENVSLSNTAVQANDTLTVAAKNITTQSGSTLSSTNGSVALNAKETVDASETTIDAKGGDATTTAKEVSYKNSSINATGNVDITSSEGDITFTATPVNSGANVTINSAANIKGEVTEDGGSLITAQNNVEVTAKANVSLPSATIKAKTGHANISGQEVNLTASGVTAEKAVTIDASNGNITASGGTYESKSENVTLNATGDFTAADAKIYANQAAVNFNIDNNISLNNTEVQSKEALNVQAKNIETTNGTSLTSTDNGVSITTSGKDGFIALSNTTVKAQNGDINATAGSLSLEYSNLNASAETGKGNVSLTSQAGDITLTATPIASSNNVTISSAKDITGVVTEGAGSLITANNSVDIAAQGNVNLPSAQVTAQQGHANITGQNVDLTSSSVIAQQEVEINATTGNISASLGTYQSNTSSVNFNATQGNLTVTSGKIYAKKDAVNFNIGENITLNNTEVVANKALAISAKNIDVSNVSSLTSTDGSVALTAEQNISTSQTTINATGDVSYQAVQNVNTSQTTINTTSGNITVKGQEVTINSTTGDAQNVDICATTGNTTLKGGTSFTANENVTVRAGADKTIILDNASLVAKDNASVVATNIESANVSAVIANTSVVRAENNATLGALNITSLAADTEVYAGNKLVLKDGSTVIGNNLTIKGVNGVEISNGTYTRSVDQDTLIQSVNGDVIIENSSGYAVTLNITGNNTVSMKNAEWHGNDTNYAYVTSTNGSVTLDNTSLTLYLPVNVTAKTEVNISNGTNVTAQGVNVVGTDVTVDGSTINSKDKPTNVSGTNVTVNNTSVTSTDIINVSAKENVSVTGTTLDGNEVKVDGGNNTEVTNSTVGGDDTTNVTISGNNTEVDNSKVTGTNTSVTGKENVNVTNGSALTGTNVTVSSENNTNVHGSKVGGDDASNVNITGNNTEVNSSTVTGTNTSVTGKENVNVTNGSTVTGSNVTVSSENNTNVHGSKVGGDDASNVNITGNNTEVNSSTVTGTNTSVTGKENVNVTNGSTVTGTNVTVSSNNNTNVDGSTVGGDNTEKVTVTGNNTNVENSTVKSNDNTNISGNTTVVNYSTVNGSNIDVSGNNSVNITNSTTNSSVGTNVTSSNGTVNLTNVSGYAPSLNVTGNTGVTMTGTDYHGDNSSWANVTTTGNDAPITLENTSLTKYKPINVNGTGNVTLTNTTLSGEGVKVNGTNVTVDKSTVDGNDGDTEITSTNNTNVTNGSKVTGNNTTVSGNNTNVDNSTVTGNETTNVTGKENVNVTNGSTVDGKQITVTSSNNTNVDGSTVGGDDTDKVTITGNNTDVENSTVKSNGNTNISGNTTVVNYSTVNGSNIDVSSNNSVNITNSTTNSSVGTNVTSSNGTVNLTNVSGYAPSLNVTGNTGVTITGTDYHGDNSSWANVTTTGNDAPITLENTSLTKYKPINVNGTGNVTLTNTTLSGEGVKVNGTNVTVDKSTVDGNDGNTEITSTNNTNVTNGSEVTGNNTTVSGNNTNVDGAKVSSNQTTNISGNNTNVNNSTVNGSNVELSGNDKVNVTNSTTNSSVGTNVTSSNGTVNLTNVSGYAPSLNVTGNTGVTITNTTYNGDDSGWANVTTTGDDSPITLDNTSLTKYKPINVNGTGNVTLTNGTTLSGEGVKVNGTNVTVDNSTVDGNDGDTEITSSNNTNVTNGSEVTGNNTTVSGNNTNVDGAKVSSNQTTNISGNNTNVNNSTVNGSNVELSGNDKVNVTNSTTNSSVGTNVTSSNGTVNLTNVGGFAPSLNVTGNTGVTITNTTYTGDDSGWANVTSTGEGSPITLDNTTLTKYKPIRVTGTGNTTLTNGTNLTSNQTTVTGDNITVNSSVVTSTDSPLNLTAKHNVVTDNGTELTGTEIVITGGDNVNMSFTKTTTTGGDEATTNITANNGTVNLTNVTGFSPYLNIDGNKGVNTTNTHYHGNDGGWANVTTRDPDAPINLNNTNLSQYKPINVKTDDNITLSNGTNLTSNSTHVDGRNITVDNSTIVSTDDNTTLTGDYVTTANGSVIKGHNISITANKVVNMSNTTTETIGGQDAETNITSPTGKVELTNVSGYSPWLNISARDGVNLTNTKYHGNDRGWSNVTTSGSDAPINLDNTNLTLYKPINVNGTGTVTLSNGTNLTSNETVVTGSNVNIDNSTVVSTDKPTNITATHNVTTNNGSHISGTKVHITGGDNVDMKKTTTHSDGSTNITAGNGTVNLTEVDGYAPSLNITGNTGVTTTNTTYTGDDSDWANVTTTITFEGEYPFTKYLCSTDPFGNVEFDPRYENWVHGYTRESEMKEYTAKDHPLTPGSDIVVDQEQGEIVTAGNGRINIGSNIATCSLSYVDILTTYKVSDADRANMTWEQIADKYKFTAKDREAFRQACEILPDYLKNLVSKKSK
ncbi:ESPR-type extended signal peptide-containing protein [Psittacicella hinzii]|uniref:ESPR-type extended signal peptide-containing protein n=1 Tax=Psittacicella hinzii TaxID=2028575 RepID=UPI003618B5CF